MVSPSEKVYIETKNIKKGFSKLTSPFAELADWIFLNFGVRPLNIIYDILEHNKRPRLQVIFEFYKDNIAFITDNGFPNPSRQEKVQEAFHAIILKDQKYVTENLFVLFSSFEPIAKEEANGKISNQKLDELEANLNDKEIWKIQRNFSTGIFFFYSDDQVKQNEFNGKKEHLKKEYFKLIKDCDEFGYFDESNFFIKLDSKENFDKNYQSNWFYYFKDN